MTESRTTLTLRPEAFELAEALERTDQALRAVLAGKPVRDADEILLHNSFLLFAAPKSRDDLRV